MSEPDGNLLSLNTATVRKQWQLPDIIDGCARHGRVGNAVEARQWPLAGELAAREKAVHEALTKVENLKLRPAVDPQIIRTYEAMDPVAGAQALKELAGQNMEVAVAILAGMTPKKAGKLMDQLAPLDAKLAGRLSEKVGMSKPKDPSA